LLGRQGEKYEGDDDNVVFMFEKLPRCCAELPRFFESTHPTDARVKFEEGLPSPVDSEFAPVVVHKNTSVKKAKIEALVPTPPQTPNEPERNFNVSRGAMTLESSTYVDSFRGTMRFLTRTDRQSILTVLSPLSMYLLLLRTGRGLAPPHLVLSHTNLGLTRLLRLELLPNHRLGVRSIILRQVRILHPHRRPPGPAQMRLITPSSTHIATPLPLLRLAPWLQLRLKTCELNILGVYPLPMTALADLSHTLIEPRSLLVPQSRVVPRPAHLFNRRAQVM
jgi:hypothetical protein